jgi:hypothetical protein
MTLPPPPPAGHARVHFYLLADQQEGEPADGAALARAVHTVDTRPGGRSLHATLHRLNLKPGAGGAVWLLSLTIPPETGPPDALARQAEKAMRSATGRDLTIFDVPYGTDIMSLLVSLAREGAPFYGCHAAAPG